MPTNQTQAFQEYFEYCCRQANAVTLGQQIDVANKLLAPDEIGQIRVPNESGQVYRLNVSDPKVKAILDGRTVSLGGTDSGTSGPTGRRNLNRNQKIMVVAACVLGPILIVMLMAATMRGRASAAEPTVTPTELATATPTELPRATITPTITSTPSVPITQANGSSSSFSLNAANVGQDGNDPVSLDLGESTYGLSVGRIKDGVWTPQAAEWLAGTEVRRVIAVPYSADLANALRAMQPGLTVTLRLRSGERVEYALTAVQRVKRFEIEQLTNKGPSIAVVLHGERSNDRWVLLGEPRQRADFSAYAASTGVTETAPLTPTLPPIQAVTQLVITDSRTITHTEAGLVLTIERCRRVNQIGEQTTKLGQYEVCDLTLRALQPTSYSDSTLAITEQDWLNNAADWWPDFVRVSNALGDGELMAAGEQVSGGLAGIVVKPKVGKSSTPALVWEQAGTRYVIDVSAAEQ